jgi:hypothetical protein
MIPNGGTPKWPPALYGSMHRYFYREKLKIVQTCGVNELHTGEEIVSETFANGCRVEDLFKYILDTFIAIINWKILCFKFICKTAFKNVLQHHKHKHTLPPEMMKMMKAIRNRTVVMNEEHVVRR